MEHKYRGEGVSAAWSLACQNRPGPTEWLVGSERPGSPAGYMDGYRPSQSRRSSRPPAVRPDGRRFLAFYGQPGRLQT